MKAGRFTSLIVGALLPVCSFATRQFKHIIVIMCDDMGFSDLGCYGGEIRTPNIDNLAQRGVRFTQFKNCSRSCPSRASLLTGMYPHEVGLGWMTNADEHRKGYRGQIDGKFPTIAEILRKVGYRTYMSGKWHVTRNSAYDAPNGSYPVERGFERYYGSLAGGGSYYHPQPLYSQLQRIDSVPDDYYYTTAISDSAVSFIHQHPAEEPMFLYVAHFAPHLPLQAPSDLVERWLPVYRKGYDILRKERFQKQKEMGFFPDTLSLPVFDSEFSGGRPSWPSLSPNQQEQWAKEMATYAAMIEVMDQGVGRIVQALRERKMLEHSLLLFLSDNGASSEGGRMGQLMADLSNTPFRCYKQWSFQGGTSAPLILFDGNLIPKQRVGAISSQLCHIIDILPTCLCRVGVSVPSKMHGKSILPAAIQGKDEERTLYFEHQGSCAVIEGNWKLVRRRKDSPWQLYKLDTDPFEVHNRASIYPSKVKKMEKKWLTWARKGKVLPLEDLPWIQRIERYR